MAIREIMWECKCGTIYSKDKMEKVILIGLIMSLFVLVGCDSDEEIFIESLGINTNFTVSYDISPTFIMDCTYDGEEFNITFDYSDEHITLGFDEVCEVIKEEASA